MSRRNKEQPIIEDICIEGVAAEGKAMAHIDGKVVFVPFVVPGDVVDIKLLKQKKTYCEGKMVAVKRPSQLRIKPVCPHFGICGGCKWQTLKYEEQLKAKQQQVVDNLERLGNVDCSKISAICGSDRVVRYRNKLEYTFSTKAWKASIDSPDEQDGALGFHIPGMFDKVLNIDSCILQPELSDRIRLHVREYAKQNGLAYYDIRNHTGFLRNLVVRNTEEGEWMVIVIVAEDKNELLIPLLKSISDKFSEVTSLQYIVNSKMNDSYGDLDVKLYSGSPYITERMRKYDGQGYLEFRINPKSFYQTNSQQAQKLYSFVADFAELSGDEVVYDLYTGTGTIAQFVAGMCKKVVGIEYVPEAIADARINAENNGIANVTFFDGDMAQILTDDFVTQNGTPDVVITDPPRAGMHEKVVKQLLNMAPRKIVYVSCNPATQARDLKLLSDLYEVGRIQPVDMFPHTQHIENVVELNRKK